MEYLKKREASGGIGLDKAFMISLDLGSSLLGDKI